MVIPFMGRNVCPGRESDCLKPTGTGVGVSARMYNDSNSLGDKAKEGRRSERRHAGTGEGISARIHVANSHGDKAEEGRRSDRDGCRHFIAESTVDVPIRLFWQIFSACTALFSCPSA